MNDLTYSQLITENRKLASEFSGEPFQMLIFSNTVVDNLKECIEYDLISQGINAQVLSITELRTPLFCQFTIPQ